MEQFIYGLKISIIAMAVVYLALAVIACIITIFRKLDKSLPDAIHPGKPRMPPDRREISPEALAVIMAAVAVATDKRGHVKRIRYSSAPQENSWSVEGRITIMASHTIQH